MDLKRWLLSKGNEAKEFAGLNNYLAQAFVVAALYVLVSSVVKGLVLRVDHRYWADTALLLAVLCGITLRRCRLAGLISIERQEYTVRRRWFLIGGSLFHGGMIIALKMFRGSVETSRDMVSGLALAGVVGVVWAITFHFLSMHKITHTNEQSKM